MSETTKWDRRHREAAGPGEPLEVVTANDHLLPARGRALDLACGLGANALYLAARGLDVAAWDLSRVAAERVATEAARRAVAVVAEARDVTTRPPEPDAFDVITIGHFLERPLAPAIAAALRPAGLLFYQTFTRERREGPNNPDFLLEVNELLQLFAGLRVLYYREDGPAGDPARGIRGQALLVARRDA